MSKIIYVQALDGTYTLQDSDGITFVCIPFTFNTPSGPLGAILSNTIMNRVDVLVTTTFDDPNATLKFGLVGGSSSAFLDTTDSNLGQNGQYESGLLVPIESADMLSLTITPGLSTQGAGLLFYSFSNISP